MQEQKTTEDIPTRKGSAVLRVCASCKPSPWFLLPMAANNNNTAVSPPRSKALRLRKCYCFQMRGFLCQCRSCKGQLSICTNCFTVKATVQLALLLVHAKMMPISVFQYARVSAGIQDSPKLGDFSSVHTSNTSPRLLSKTLNALHLQSKCTLICTSEVSLCVATHKIPWCPSMELAFLFLRLKPRTHYLLRLRMFCVS